MLWDAITYPCLRFMLPSSKSSYQVLLSLHCVAVIFVIIYDVSNHTPLAYCNRKIMKDVGNIDRCDITTHMKALTAGIVPLGYILQLFGYKANHSPEFPITFTGKILLSYSVFLWCVFYNYLDKKQTIHWTFPLLLPGKFVWIIDCTEG